MKAGTPCELCGAPATSRHHLVPRKIIRQRAAFTPRRLPAPNKTIPVCTKCHEAIHEIPNRVLADECNTVTALRARLGRQRITQLSTP